MEIVFNSYNINMLEKLPVGKWTRVHDKARRASYQLRDDTTLNVTWNVQITEYETAFGFL